MQCDGSEFISSYETMEQAIAMQNGTQARFGACYRAVAGASYQRVRKVLS